MASSDYPYRPRVGLLAFLLGPTLLIFLLVGSGFPHLLRAEPAESAPPAAPQESADVAPQAPAEPEQEQAEQDVEVETERPSEIEGEIEEPAAPAKKKRIIGATARFQEKQSGFMFNARIDTGAKTCSLHIKKLHIEDEVEKMRDNIGKVVHFQVKNGEKESHVIESKIQGYVIIKTADVRERRYKVPLILRCGDFEKEVLVTLNDRSDMEFPLLIGRNFLRGDFLVDVELDNGDK